MSELEIHPRAAEVVLAAVNAAGPATNPAAWRAKVNEMIPVIASMLRDASPALRTATEVMNSAVFPAELVSWEVEPSSTRVLVQLRTEPSRKYPDGIEPIRTDRTDSGRGKAMLKRLEQAGAGARLLVYKAMEAKNDGSGESVRILAHFDVLSTAGARGGTADAPASSTGAARREGSTPSERTIDAETGEIIPTSDGWSALGARFDKLPAKAKARAVKRMREEGISFPEPTEGQASRFLQIVADEETES